MIRVGIAGFGKIGQLRANELEKNQNAEIVAVFDVKKPKVQLVTLNFLNLSKNF